jgi:DNA-binding transcriptional LysR family regulator
VLFEGGRVDIRQLSNFVQVYDDGNMTKSAGQLHISQQGLSMSIIRLEKELGRKLFVRTPIGVSPTADGEFFYEQAKAILGQVNKCEEYFSNDLLGREVTVAVTHGIAEFCPVRVQESLVNLNSDFNIRKTLCGAVRAEYLVENEGYDLGFTINNINPHKFKSFLLFESQIVFVVNRNHPLARQDSISINQLQGQQVCIPHESYKSTHRFLQYCRDADIIFDKQGETNGSILSINLVKANREVLALTVEPFVRLVNDPDVKMLYVHDADFSWNPHLIYKIDTKLPQSVQRYVDFVLSNFA